MPKVGKMMLRRIVLVAVFILLQLAVMVGTAIWLSEYEKWVHVLLTVLSLAAIVYIINDKTNSSYKVAWIMLILAFPVAGILIYLTFGGRRLSQRTQRRMHLMEDLTRDHLHQNRETLQTLQELSDPAVKNSEFLYRVSGYPVYSGTKTTYFSLGDLAYPRMLEELRKAERYIFLEYFIIGEGQMWEGVLEILKDKAARGVDVRVMYDDFGCITTLPNYYDRKLQSWGIQAKVFNPLKPILSGRLNNRSHRKLMVVDGKVGFTGGINLADEYINKRLRFGHWKDCALRLEGEAVWAMTVMFLSMWDSQTGEREDLDLFKPTYPKLEGEGFVQPFSDSPLDQEDIAEGLLLSLFHRACQSIYIMTPYLILDDKMMGALQIAAKSGVDVRILTPHIPDKWYVHGVSRAHYESLTEAGVQIYEYTPGFIHSKTYLVDGRYAMVGSVNLDFRSLYLHFENAVYVFDAECTEEIAEDFEKTFAVSEEMTWQKCRNTGFWQRFARAALRLFAPLM